MDKIYFIYYFCSTNELEYQTSKTLSVLLREVTGFMAIRKNPGIRVCLTESLRTPWITKLHNFRQYLSEISLICVEKSYLIQRSLHLKWISMHEILLTLFCNLCKKSFNRCFSAWKVLAFNSIFALWTLRVKKSFNTFCYGHKLMCTYHILRFS